MIISDEHRYVFVQLPHTGSTAVGRELRERYSGRSILHKHATYEEFLKVATPDECTYFVFSGIRHPLDEAVSIYHKYRTDHRHRFTDPVKLAKRGWFTRHRDVIKYRFVAGHEADFPTFFRRFYRWPYNNWSHLSHRRFDYVLRYERLQEDFATVLQRLGLQAQRPLPLVNATGARENDYTAYYTPDIVPQAKRVFAPFMEQWGYGFPSSWGAVSISRRLRVEFAAFNAVHAFYWRFVRS